MSSSFRAARRGVLPAKPTQLPARRPPPRRHGRCRSSGRRIGAGAHTCAGGPARPVPRRGAGSTCWSGPGRTAGGGHRRTPHAGPARPTNPARQENLTCRGGLPTVAMSKMLYRGAVVKPTRVTNSIRALRFSHDEMTQADLAHRVGVTRQTIIAIEQGRYSPSLEMAFQIARVFAVPLDESSSTRTRETSGRAPAGHAVLRPAAQVVHHRSQQLDALRRFAICSMPNPSSTVSSVVTEEPNATCDRSKSPLCRAARRRYPACSTVRVPSRSPRSRRPRRRPPGACRR